MPAVNVNDILSMTQVKADLMLSNYSIEKCYEEVDQWYEELIKEGFR